MAGINFGRLDRKSSIESEPRTLNFRQIDIAREAALYVVLTRSREEAYQIFTKGLEPVETMKTREYSAEEDDLCLCKSYRCLKRRSLKDVFTAPF